jgi:hypothetical protein
MHKLTTIKLFSLKHQICTIFITKIPKKHMNDHQGLDDGRKSPLQTPMEYLAN